MSFNVGGIYVDAAKVTPKKVAEAVTRYWTKKGAVVAKSDPTKLATMSVEKTKKLGYVVLSAGPLIAIADSERYTADHGLAKHLAAELGAPVFWYTLYGATDGGVSAWFGAKKKEAPQGYGEVEEYVAENFAPPFLHLQELKPTKSDVFLSFEKVKGYDSGPEPDDEEEVDDDGERETTGGGVWKLDEKKKAPFAPRRLGKKKNSARDNLTLVFYCKNSKLTQVFEAYQRVIPAGVLRWACVGSSSTDVRLMKPGALARAAGQFAKKGGFFFVLSDDDPKKPMKEEPAIPAYAFVFSGADGKSEASRVEMRLPSDVVWQAGADKVAAFAEEIARLLGDDLYSGSCSIALTSFPLISTLRDGYAVFAEAQKHIGFDVVSDNVEALTKKIRAGARWIDFLGPVFKKTVGKTGTFRTSHEPMIDPDAKTLKALKANAKLFERAALFEDPFIEFDVDEAADRDAWERRFL